MATISAQPMLQPSLSQLGLSFQESHSLANISPMPQEEEASTQISTREIGGGFSNSEPQKSAESWERHQLISDKTLGLGVKRAKGDDV